MKALLLLVACATASCRSEGQTAPMPAPAESRPPCIHETCAERPRRLRCTIQIGYRCDEYEIQYERHCVCDAWGPALELQQ